jgi:hypothetical protein
MKLKLRDKTKGAGPRTGMTRNAPLERYAPLSLLDAQSAARKFRRPPSVPGRLRDRGMGIFPLLFTRLVEQGAGCWRWTGKQSATGYAVFRGSYLHRVMHRLFRRRISPEMVLGNRCGNRACCNPWHWEPEKRGELVLRVGSITAQNAAKEVCPKGHRLEGDNLEPSELRRGRRRCIICRRRRQAKKLRAS